MVRICRHVCKFASNTVRFLVQQFICDQFHLGTASIRLPAGQEIHIFHSCQSVLTGPSACVTGLIEVSTEVELANKDVHILCEVFLKQQK